MRRYVMSLPLLFIGYRQPRFFKTVTRFWRNNDQEDETCARLLRHRYRAGSIRQPGSGLCVGTQSPQSLAQYQGTDKASHVKDKIVEMIHLNETMYACGIACSAEGKPTASGTYLIDLLLANVCKLNVTRFPYEIARLAQDIAGGLLVTLPSEKDLAIPKWDRI